MKVLFAGFGDIAARTAAALPPGSEPLGLRRHPVAGPVEQRSCDLTDRAALAAVLAEHDCDYLVATLTPGEMSEAGYRASYLAVAENLAALLPTQRNLRRLFWVSSSSVYGASDGWLDEHSAAQPERPTARVLLAAEQALAGLPVTVLRFSGIYGPGRRRMLELVRSGRPLPGPAAQWSNRIHSDDGAGFIAHLIAADWRGEPPAPLYIVTDDHPASLGEVTSWLAAELGCAPPADGAGVARGGKRLANRGLRGSGFVLRYPSYRDGYRALLAEADG